MRRTRHLHSCTPAALQHDLTLAAAEWATQRLQRASETGCTQHARKESLIHKQNEDAAKDCRDRVIIVPVLRRVC